MVKIKSRMLITGVSGLLGNNLAYYFKDKYNILGLYHEHPVKIKGIKTQETDILSQVSLRTIIHSFKPDVILHCASLTNVDFCQKHKGLTRSVNTEATKRIVDIVRGTQAKLVYISTDSVYDGNKGNFSETENIAPQNYYGQTKYEGEKEVLKLPYSLVVRTNIFGWNIQDNKHSIAEWILNQLSHCKVIQGFKDAFFSSIYTFELARILDRAIEKDLTGIYNCASRNTLSKYEFALKLAQRFKLDTSLIRPISIDDFGFKAKRGKNLSLNANKISKALHRRLPTIEQSIEHFYQDFKSGLAAKVKQKKIVLARHCSSFVIPYSRQSIDTTDIRAVDEVLKSDFITQGPKIKEFEDALCKYTKAKYAVCVSSGTAALHIACLAGGIKPNDEVITSPITFVASANCVLYCGANPIFVDIQTDTATIDPTEITKKVTKRTKAIIPVHFAGHPCDLEEINKIARKSNLLIIEDAAHALGAEYKGFKIGSCKYSDMAVFSFHPVKSITTGEGGAVSTNRKDLYEKLIMFRNHGITKKGFINDPDGDWYYEMQHLGYNYRITDIQAALGISQLKKLDRLVAKRREIAGKYDETFKGNPYFDIPGKRKETFSACHLYPIRLKGKFANRRKEIFQELKAHGLGVQVHYIPVYWQPYYRQNFGFKTGLCPKAESYYSRAISLPLYPAMTNSQVSKVIRIVKDSFYEK